MTLSHPETVCWHFWAGGQSWTEGRKEGTARDPNPPQPRWGRRLQQHWRALPEPCEPRQPGDTSSSQTPGWLPATPGQGILFSNSEKSTRPLPEVCHNEPCSSSLQIYVPTHFRICLSPLHSSLHLRHPSTAHSVFQVFIDPYLTPHLPPALAIFSAPLWAESSGQWPYSLSSSSFCPLPSLLYLAALIFSSRWSPRPPLPLSAPHLTAGPDTTSHSKLLHAISTSRTVLSLLPCRLALGQFLVNFSTRDFWDAAASFHVWISAPCRLPPSSGSTALQSTYRLMKPIVLSEPRPCSWTRHLSIQLSTWYIHFDVLTSVSNLMHSETNP